MLQAVSRIALVVGSLACFARSAAASNVQVVAPSGAAFTNIQAAADASVDGDVVLVKTGTYPGFNLIGKSISVVADVGANVTIDGAIRVRNCTGPVLLAGLTATGKESTVEAERFGLAASTNTGALRVEHCTLRGAATFPATYCNSRHGASVRACPNVAFVGCTLEGSVLYGDGRQAGLFASESSVAIHDTTSRGGSSLCAFGYTGVAGDDGLDNDNSFVFAEHSSLSGGDGGHASCLDGARGGDGVHASGAAASVVLLDCPTSAGAAGLGNTPYACPCSNCFHLDCTLCNNDGSAGQATSAVSGATIQTVNGVYRRLDGPNVVRETQPVNVTVFGQPGEKAALLLGHDATFQWTPQWSGVQLVAAPSVARYLLIGTLPANGMLNFALPTRALPVGVQSDVLRAQALLTDGSGTARWSGSLDVVVLDSAF